MNNRVLLIDDDINILTALRRQLRKNFDMQTATSGPEALSLIASSLQEDNLFSVAVCDMHMPGMDGIETLRRIHDLSPLTVGIMLTGDADQNTAITALNSGNIFRFYSKPFDSAALGEGIYAGTRQHDLLQAELHLAENEERWRLALEAAGDGVWDWDVLNEKAVFSQGWWRMLSEPAPPSASSITEWWNRLHPEDAPQVEAQIGKLLTGSELMFKSEHRMLCHDKTYRWFLARGVALFRGTGGQALRAIGTHSDVTERREMEDTLRRQARELSILATTDPLTGLLNRRCFLEKAEAELQRSIRYGRAMTLVMVDIDFFKKVNDTWGHAAGDLVLRRVTQLLGEHLRATDALGRLGGEEFAVLLPETNEANALVVAEILRKSVEESAISLGEDNAIRVTASFGISSATGPSDSVTDILNRADNALYTAKDAGRNRIIFQA